MSTYYMNEGAFELLDLGFTDCTAHVLEARHPEHGDVGVLVRRMPFPENVSLRDLVAGHLAAEKERRAGYGVIEERATEHAGVPAIEMAVRYRHEDKAIYQAQAHLALGDTWVQFAVTAEFPAREACDAWLGGILGSLRLRGAL
ncbi:MAG: DcrB-related protein [Minicystis sp.]